MCDLSSSLKFCTCSDEVDKSKPHWILKTNCSEEYVDLNSIIVGTLNSSFRIKSEFANRLNEENLFDFDYTPNQNDHLIIKISSAESYNFVYKSNKWIAKSPFGYKTSYKHQEEQQGYINEPNK